MQVWSQSSKGCFVEAVFDTTLGLLDGGAWGRGAERYRSKRNAAFGK